VSSPLIDQYWDPALKVDKKMTPEAIAVTEIERLQGELAAAVVAANFPRRLGDASRGELALDKRRSRRVGHALRQSLSAWGGAERTATEPEFRTGAQIDWPGWLEQHQTELHGRLRFVASWAKLTTNLKFGKSAVVRLSQEHAWLIYAMRD
jgi:hypothetical protein